jgi:DNA-binding SARP family transcriptional activator
MNDRRPGGHHTRLVLRTLGDASLRRLDADACAVNALGPGKPLALVVYLACSPGRTATRDHLIDLLWANLDVKAARHALRQTLWHLRRSLDLELIRARDRELTLCAPLDSDRDAFVKAIEARDFERAVQIYEGEFLPMFAAPGGADFEHWAEMERYRLRTLFLQAAESLVRDWLAKGRFQKARRLAVRARDADPNEQRTWRLVLEACLAANERVAAQIEAHALEERLAELELPPEPQTRMLLALARQIAPKIEADTGRRTLVPELIGREREFAAILSSWSAARSGHGRHVHVTGGPGLGKTRLLADVHARLRASGARAVLVRAAPGERHVPYTLASALAGALAQLPGAEGVSAGAAGALVALNPTLSNQYAAMPDRTVGLEALRRRKIALAELLAAVAEEAPVALLIDDIHWADSASRQIVASLLCRPAGQPVLAVTTARPGPDGAVPVSETERLKLEPLSEAETAALVASLAALPEEPWAERFPQELHAATRGSPLVILETLQLGLERGWLTLIDGTWGCPDQSELRAELACGGALRRRLEELVSAEKALLLLLCVAGTPLRAAVLELATGQDRKAVLQHLQALEVRGLVVRAGEEWALAHDEIAALAVELAAAEARHAAHRAVGRALLGSAGGDPQLLLRAGRHLAQVGESKPLNEAFARWVTAVRRGGDRRPLKLLTADFLGTRPETGEVRRLVAGLPLRVRLGLTSSPRVAAAVAGLAGAAAILAATLVSPSRPPPDDVLYVLRAGPDGDFTGYEAPIRREGWEELGALDLGDLAEPVPALRRLSQEAVESLVPDPPGGRWAYMRLVADSGGQEVFLLSADGEERRLTYTRKDDVPRSWSPDGRLLVIMTGRWNPYGWQDLAVLDPEAGRVRQLTASDHSDVAAYWSRDGTRIAFDRSVIAGGPADATAAAEAEICWVTPDGALERCLTPELPVVGLVGWYDVGQVLAIVREGVGGAWSLARIALETGELRIVDRGVRNASLSPDGRWVASLRAGGDLGAPTWYVYPTDRPDLAVPVRVGEEPIGPTAFLAWGRARPDSGHLERLEIAVPAAVTVGVPLRLTAQGFDAAGRALSPPVIYWRSADTTVAAIDPTTGVIEPRRVGTVIIFASAGGWREDSVRVAIEPPASQTLLSEDWRGGLEREWVPYGDPPPSVVKGPWERPAFWNGGDGYYNSGVYSRRAFRASRGLGVQAELFTARSRPAEQALVLGIFAWDNPGAVKAWDHRSGAPPVGTRGCTFYYPAGDGFNNMRRVRVVSAAASATLEVGPAVATGKRYVVRLQLFPDGTCGVALDGVPLWRSQVPVPLDVAYRIILEGKSVATKMLVGRLEIWEGVRGGVTWSDLWK